MADFNGAKPVKTVRDNEFKVKLVDGASGEAATNFISIVKEGDAVTGSTNDFGVPVMGEDASGNYQLLKFTANGLQVDPGTVTVTATDLDIRDLTHASDSVKVGDGTDFLAVNSDGSINVVTVDDPNETEVLDYQTSATVAAGAVSTHVYVVTSAKIFKGLSVLVGARGAVKVEVGLSADGSTLATTKMVYFQDPKENRQYDIPAIQFTGDGTGGIAVKITNLDGASSDVYSTLQGTEK